MIIKKTKIGALKSLAVAGVIGACSVGVSQAALVIGPNVGYSGSFNWSGGLGPIDGIGDGAEIEWSMTVLTASAITQIHIFDEFNAGDEFDVTLDGGTLAYDTTFIDGSGYFNGFIDNVALSAGTHTIGVNVTAIGGGAGGAASISISPIAVPEPSSALLATAGLGLLAFRRKR